MRVRLLTITWSMAIMLMTMMFTGTSSGNIGLNVAIPINLVKAALPTLKAAANGAAPR